MMWKTKKKAPSMGQPGPRYSEGEGKGEELVKMAIT